MKPFSSFVWRDETRGGAEEVRVVARRVG